MNCYETIDLMGDALEEGVPPESRAGFEEHLEECAPCRNYLDQIRVTLQALERLPRSSITSRRKSDLIAAFLRERHRSE